MNNKLKLALAGALMTHALTQPPNVRAQPQGCPNGTWSVVGSKCAVDACGVLQWYTTYYWKCSTVPGTYQTSEFCDCYGI